MTDDYYRESITQQQFRTSMVERCIELMGHGSHEVREAEADHPFDDFVIVTIDLRGGRLDAPNEIQLGMQHEDSGWKVGTIYNATDYGCSLL